MTAEALGWAVVALTLAVLLLVILAPVLAPRPRSGPSVCRGDLADTPERRLRRWQE